MGIEDKMVDYLRSKEVTEPELIRIYKQFGKKVYDEGFDKGCDYVRGIMRRQKAARGQCLKNRYKKFLTELDDYLHAIQ